LVLHPAELGVHHKLSGVLDVQERLVCTHPEVDSELLVPIEDNVEALVGVENTVLERVLDLFKVTSHHFEDPYRFKLFTLCDHHIRFCFREDRPWQE
jgi:hypothetical protein